MQNLQPNSQTQSGIPVAKPPGYSPDMQTRFAQNQPQTQGYYYGADGQAYLVPYQNNMQQQQYAYHGQGGQPMQQQQFYQSNQGAQPAHPGYGGHHQPMNLAQNVHHHHGNPEHDPASQHQVHNPTPVPNNGGGSDQPVLTTMYSPAMSGANIHHGNGQPIRTENSDGRPHIGSLNPNFTANKSFDSQNGHAGYMNNAGEHLHTDNYGMSVIQSPMMEQRASGRVMPGKQKIYFGGNVSMQSSNDAISRLSHDQNPYGNQMAVNKIRDCNSIRGGLSDATSNNDMMHDRESLRSNDVLRTPSSMMGSQNNINTNQYLLTSPPGTRRDTHQTNLSHEGGQSLIRPLIPAKNYAGGIPQQQLQVHQFQSPKLGGSPYSNNNSGGNGQMAVNQQRSPIGMQTPLGSQETREASNPQQHQPQPSQGFSSGCQQPSQQNLQQPLNVMNNLQAQMMHQQAPTPGQFGSGAAQNMSFNPETQKQEHSQQPQQPQQPQSHSNMGQATDADNCLMDNQNYVDEEQQHQQQLNQSLSHNANQKQQQQAVGYGVDANAMKMKNSQAQQQQYQQQSMYHAVNMSYQSAQVTDQKAMMPTLVCNECQCSPCPHFQTMQPATQPSQQPPSSYSMTSQPSQQQPPQQPAQQPAAAQNPQQQMAGPEQVIQATPVGAAAADQNQNQFSFFQQMQAQNSISTGGVRAIKVNDGNAMMPEDGQMESAQDMESAASSKKQPQNRSMINFSENMIKDAGADFSERQSMGGDASNAQKQQKVITFKNRDYLLYEGRIIDEKEADRIYCQYHEILSQKKTTGTTGGAASANASDTESIQNNEGSHVSNLSGNAVPTTGQPAELAQSSAQWKKDETMLLQYIILNVADQRDTLVENYSDSDWQTVANLVPGRSSLQCQKRWLFIQQIEGKKSAWTARETEILKKIAEEVTAQSMSSNLNQPKEWTRIAEEFNKAMGPGSHRKPRQCRERWINVIDPNVRRDKWTMEEEYKILKLWKELGSKWHEISLQIEGRTEIQVKNRFNCLIKKDSQSAAAGQGQSEVVDRLLERMLEKNRNLEEVM